MRIDLGLSGLDQLKRSRFVLLVVSALGLPTNVFRLGLKLWH